MCVKKLVGIYGDIHSDKADKFRKVVKRKGLKQNFAIEEALDKWADSVGESF